MTTLRLKELCALLALWLLGIGLALAQASNSIEAFDVAQQGGNVVIRITTKEPVKTEIGRASCRERVCQYV